MSLGSKVIAKVKFFQKLVKSQASHKVKIVGTDRKVLSQGTHMCSNWIQDSFIGCLEYTAIPPEGYQNHVKSEACRDYKLKTQLIMP